MSPKIKKLLMIGGALVGGYIVYAKFIKKSAPATVPLAAAKSAALTQKLAAVQLLPQHTAGLGLLEELGLEETLGSLGGKR